MTFMPSYSGGNFVPESVSLSEDPKELVGALKRILESHARLINRKDTAQYEKVETQNNQTYFGASPQTKRYVFRKVIDTGALPNAGTTSIAHNIAGISNSWDFVRIYGVAKEPAGVAPRPRFISMPNGGPAYGVQLMVDTVNVHITTTVNLSAFTSSTVVLEFIKNA